TVFFPAPEGALKTTRNPGEPPWEPSPPLTLVRPPDITSGVGRLDGLLFGCEAVGHRLGLDGREDHMLRIGDDHRAGPAPVGGIDQLALLAGLCDDPLDGGRFGTHDGDDPVGGDDVAKADV